MTAGLELRADIKLLLEKWTEDVETLRTSQFIEFDKFLWAHGSCDGFSQDGDEAFCSTHNVGSHGDKGYLPK